MLFLHFFSLDIILNRYLFMICLLFDPTVRHTGHSVLYIFIFLINYACASSRSKNHKPEGLNDNKSQQIVFLMDRVLKFIKLNRLQFNYVHYMRR